MLHATAMAKILLLCAAICATAVFSANHDELFCAWRLKVMEDHDVYTPGTAGDAFARFPYSPLADRVGNPLMAEVPRFLFYQWLRELDVDESNVDFNRILSLAQFAISAHWRNGNEFSPEVPYQPRVRLYRGLFREWFKEAEVEAALRQYVAKFTPAWKLFEEEALAAIRRDLPPPAHFSAPYTYRWLRPNREKLGAFLQPLTLGSLKESLRDEVREAYGVTTSAASGTR